VFPSDELNVCQVCVVLSVFSSSLVLCLHALTCVCDPPLLRVQELSSVQDVHTFCGKVGYPVLVRPSYVLSGAAMRVVRREEDLEGFLHDAGRVSQEHPVVVTKFVEGAQEIEFDGVADGRGNLVTYAVSQHVEQAGVHSGDATLVLPPVDLSTEVQQRVVGIAGQVADGLNIRGPFNMQLLYRDNEMQVIECNLRASRSFPFVAKTYGIPFVDLATRVAVSDEPVEPMLPPSAGELKRVSVKAPMFSFQRLLGADPTLGVEMASTGEVACSGRTKEEALLKAMLSSGQRVPSRAIYVHTGSATDAGVSLAESRVARLRTALKELTDSGLQLFVSESTAPVLEDGSLSFSTMDAERVGEAMRARELDLVGVCLSFEHTFAVWCVVCVCVFFFCGRVVMTSKYSDTSCLRCLSKNKCR
jgi:Carbamoyl-phosphate synthase L chain, ATP binding domain